MRGGLRRADAGCGPGRGEQRQGAGRAEASRVEAGSLCGAGLRRADAGCGPGRGEQRQGAGRVEASGSWRGGDCAPPSPGRGDAAIIIILLLLIIKES
jgi:hypothetical protein